MVRSNGKPCTNKIGGPAPPGARAPAASAARPGSSDRTRRNRTDTPSARRWGTLSWHGLRQGRGHRKRMPEDDPLHVPRAAAQQNAKGFRAVRGVQDQSMLRRELARGLALDRRRAVAAAQTVHDVGGAGSRERYAHASEQAPRPPGQPRGPPAIGDERRSDAHTDHARGPAEPGDTEP